jgi:two-component system, OmpR family, response regulator
MQNEKVKIVVVDDVADAAQALAVLLSLEGCDVATATTSEQAIVLIEDFEPHAVMLDVNMPGIDGYELATLLRHRYQEKIVLIAVTGSDPEHARVASTFAIVDHYFQKPVDAKKLRKLLGGFADAGDANSD